MIKYFTIEDLLKHYLQKKFHILNGTGLGLALSKKIIEAHGGTLIVTSSDETGTVFTITLPV